jgi:serine/threonine-protein kinase
MSPHEFDWQEALDNAVAPGDVIAGRYRIDGAIGAGGMGVVLKAWHLVFDARVAIKFLLPERVANREARTRFDREARATFQIRSENVPRVMDIGTLDTGIPYIVMEYLRGKTLSELVADTGALDIPTAIDYLLQACDAVAEAHALGIVHRDIKPGNLFLTHRANGSPCIKVLDFGLAKAGYHKGSLTTVHRSMGTPRYMSPEQWLSARDVGPATDVWALGATLFQILTGLPPFQADEVDVLCQLVLSSTAPPLSSLRPDAPAELDAIVAKCLQRNPRHRYDSVTSLAGALVTLIPDPNRQASQAEASLEPVPDEERPEPSPQGEAAPWVYEAAGADARVLDAPQLDPTVQDAHPERAAKIVVDEYTTAQMADRHPAEQWVAQDEEDDGPELATVAYDPGAVGRSPAPKPAGRPVPRDEPEIEWSEDGGAIFEKPTEVMRVDAESSTARLRRNEAMERATKPVGKRRPRRRTSRARKFIGLVLLAIVGFLGGAALTKLFRDMQRPAADPPPVVLPPVQLSRDGGEAPPSTGGGPTARVIDLESDAAEDPKLPDGGSILLDLDEPDGGAAEVPDEPAPPRATTRRRTRRGRPDRRVRRATRLAQQRLAGAWDRIVGPLASPSPTSRDR